jgi:hypothetical protein
MTDVVDADELLRRIQRGRDRAAGEARSWRERAQGLTATDPDGAREASVRASAYEAVLDALQEIAAPGAPPPAPPAGAEGGSDGGAGVRQVT